MHSFNANAIYAFMLMQCYFLSCLVLLKLRKEYLIMVNYKHMLNCRSKYEQIGVSNTFLRHTQKKLFTFKNSPVFLAHPVYIYIYKHQQNTYNMDAR